MNNIKTWITVVSAGVALFLAVAGGMWAAEEHYAKQADHDKLTIEVADAKKDIKIVKLERHLLRAKERVWMLEKEFGIDCKTCPAKYFKEYNGLVFDIDSMEKEIRRLENK